MRIYKTTNLINNKIYVGKDRLHRDNYYGSGVIIRRAILKYGKENFKKEILEECEFEKELNEKEKFWIKELNSIVPNGYNITPGGEGGDTFTNNPNKEQIREKYKERPKPKITGKSLEEVYGNKKAQIIRNNLSNSHKNLPGFWMNKRRKDETKNKISNTVRKLHKDGKLKSFGTLIKDGIIKLNRKGKTYEEIYGKEKADIARKNVGKSSLGRKAMLNYHHTQETKDKIRNKLKGNIPWNKGLNKNNDERIKNIGLKSGNSRKGTKNSIETKIKKIKKYV